MLRDINIGCEKKGIVYAIVNTINGKIYIGSTNCFFKRKSAHIRNLEANKHHSIHLQRAFNKYGEQAFEFDILQEVENIDDLLFYEQKWIDLTQCLYDKYGYNINPKASESAIPKLNAEQIKRRAETLRKTLATPEAKAKKSAIGKTMKGRRNFYHTRKDRFTFPYQKLTAENAIDIINLVSQKTPRKLIMEKYNVSRTLIKNIASGKNWKSLKQE